MRHDGREVPARGGAADGEFRRVQGEFELGGWGGEPEEGGPGVVDGGGEGVFWC